MLILNSGGTFNKRYNSISGDMEVPCDSLAVEEILSSVKSKYDMAGVLFKDSLDMDINDRKLLASIIIESHDDKFLIIHGTDTIDETAHFLSEIFEDRVVVLTGSMKPYELDKVEPSFNLGMAMGFLKSNCEFGVFICMNGYVEKWDKLRKNKDLGRFEIVE
jgi:L-asparaginase